LKICQIENLLVNHFLVNHFLGVEQMVDQPIVTERDEAGDLVAELAAAGFANAREVGRGGFGVVYRCSRVRLARVVAIKVLTDELDEDRTAAAALSIAIGAPLIAAMLGPFHTHCETRTRAQLGAAEFQTAWDQGTALTVDKAVAFGLAAPADDHPPSENSAR
jgi:hypothetical protein